MPKKALITGITGQDGSYLAEFLLSKGYEVHGLIRHVALDNQIQHTSRINHIVSNLHLHPASITSQPSIFNAINKIKPDEIYHLAAQSYVSESFKDEFSTFDININGTHFILNAFKEIVPESRLYFAATSEMFGKTKDCPQNENTPFHPRSPYAISKATGYDLVRHYRESYNLFCSSGILFNHESPRRGMEFVTRKVSNGAAKIKAGLSKELRMGNLNARRDWGFAGDYVEAMWLMLQQDIPDDFVIATGETHSVKEMAEIAFQQVGLNWQDYIVIDPEFIRPAEVNILQGDYTKARERLGWNPKMKFNELIKTMVDYDYNN